MPERGWHGTAGIIRACLVEQVDRARRTLAGEAAGDALLDLTERLLEDLPSGAPLADPASI